MEKNLLIFGAGQYGAVIKELAEAVGEFETISFLDDLFGLEEQKGDISKSVIGKLNQYEAFRAEYGYAIVSIGNPEIRMEWTKKLLKAGYLLPTLISPRAYVSPSAQLSEGVVVEPMAVLNANVHIGEGSLVMAGAIINHNAFVDDYCNIQCGAVVMSNTVVSAYTMTQPNKTIR